MTITLEGLNKALYYVLSFAMGVFAIAALAPLFAASSIDVPAPVPELALISTGSALGIGAFAMAFCLIRIGLYLADLVWGPPMPDVGKEKATIISDFQRMPAEKRQQVIRRQNQFTAGTIGAALGFLVISVGFGGMIGFFAVAGCIGVGMVAVMSAAYVRLYREADRISSTTPA